MPARRGDRGQRPAIEGSARATVEQAGDVGSLDQEIAYYLAHLPEWHAHEGEHVLIRGQEHFGFHASRDGALQEGFRQFGQVAFLVKQVVLDEERRPVVGVML